jgi:thioredoxin 1
MQTGSKIALVIVLVVIVAVLGLKSARKEPAAPDNAAASASATRQDTAEETPEADLSPARRALAEAKEQGRPALLCIHSKTCIPCKAMEALLREIDPEFKGRVPFVKVLVDDPQEQSLVEEYQIELIPTTFLLDRHGKQVQKRVGVWPKEELVAELKRLAGE